VIGPRLRTPAIVAILILLVAGAGAAGYAETHALRHHRSPAPSTLPTPPAALALATAAPSSVSAPSTAPAPNPTSVAQALLRPLNASALGGDVIGRVLDVADGTVLLDDNGSRTAAPASTAKLLTAAAALSVYPATHRFTTSVVAGSTPGTVVLVGGGDPTLTAAAAGQPGAYPDAARLSSLAHQLRAEHVRRIVVDDSLFAGPSVAPQWAAEDVPSSYASAITAALVDGGRAAPGDAVRSATPDLAAGHDLARLLGDPALVVTRGTAPAGARTLATVHSAPLDELVEQMLQQSDNVIAEVLARHVASAAGRPASFTGGAAAIRTTLANLGVRIGAGMVDGSGLAASDRVSPAALTALLRLLAGSAHPRLHDVLAGLPVGAWSGTLADRYVPGTGSSAAAGAVRAKTGTLTGVSSLAGVVHDSSGRLLAFAFIADRAPSTAAADGALDRVVAALAGCGCS
jgi:D-alanyl-D-alanine carboxypeptidase/D-alanyl-D-alanine-endopeptidase (penicillin-binding protein 4)